ncbi:MAG: sensor histidine kinase, partial [Lachnospiraceae bacterium]|nr:sensor histidine kinase [Lachnospiraceae bacterium]
MLPWVFTAIFAAVSIALMAKVKMLQKNIDKICSDFTEHLSADTNTLITVSCRDKHVRRLAAEINVQLRELRKQQIKYLSGDRELKSAVTNISHDLRTPLTAICGYLDLLERE